MNRLRESFLYSIVFHILIVLLGYGIFNFIELKGLGSLNIGFEYVGLLEDNLYLLLLTLILLSIIIFTVIFVVILSLLGLSKKGAPNGFNKVNNT